MTGSTSRLALLVAASYALLTLSYEYIEFALVMRRISFWTLRSLRFLSVNLDTEMPIMLTSNSYGKFPVGK